jgi:hypothetical protein
VQVTIAHQGGAAMTHLRGGPILGQHELHTVLQGALQLSSAQLSSGDTACIVGTAATFAIQPVLGVKCLLPALIF